MNFLTLTKYSDKSVVVRGDTEKYKLELSNLHGKLNPNLKYGGSGWIFSLLNLESLKSFINYINSYMVVPEVTDDFELSTLPVPVIGTIVTVEFLDRNFQCIINYISETGDLIIIQENDNIFEIIPRFETWQIHNKTRSHKIIFN
jgi:hypothetical protein